MERERREEAADWGKQIQHWMGSKCNLHRVSDKQRKPWHGQCSSALERYGKDETWVLWQRWPHLLWNESLNQVGQQPAEGSRHRLETNKSQVERRLKCQTNKHRHIWHVRIRYVCFLLPLEGAITQHDTFWLTCRCLVDVRASSLRVARAIPIHGCGELLSVSTFAWRHPCKIITTIMIIYIK